MVEVMLLLLMQSSLTISMAIGAPHYKIFITASC